MMRALLGLVLVAVCIAQLQDRVLQPAPLYRVGASKADITPMVGYTYMFGYGIRQPVHGVHTRLWSRAVVFQDMSNNVVAVVTVDLMTVCELLKLRVIKSLNQTHPGIFDDNNLLLSATHTHSAPGGFCVQKFLSFINPVDSRILDLYTEGIATSISDAYNSRKPSRILIAQGDLPGVSINRSPTAYLRNPGSERAQYPTDVDQRMTVLKVIDENSTPRASIAWFAVHGTSLNNTNALISGDNKGVASQIVERTMRAKFGINNFVAAFPQSNSGDISPNVLGSFFVGTNDPCNRFETFECVGKCFSCLSRGEGKDMYESVEISGLKQATKALELFNVQGTELTGPISIGYTRINMATDAGLCSPALGQYFCHGTFDGPGLEDGWCSMLSAVGEGLIKLTQPELAPCHTPKIIIAADTELFVASLPFQLVQIGEFAIAGVPSEITTMAGRRIINTVTRELQSRKLLSASGIVVLTAHANSYASYIATKEEYSVQLYEGASTLFGPNTLLGIQNQFTLIAAHMANHTQLPRSDPQDVSAHPMTCEEATIQANRERQFGDSLTNPNPAYKPLETVSADFVSVASCSPVKDSYVTVQRLLERSAAVAWIGNSTTGECDGHRAACGAAGLNYEMESTEGCTTGFKVQCGDSKWATVVSDDDLETRVSWNSDYLATRATVSWLIPKNVDSGTYRIVHRFRSGDRNILTSTDSFTVA